MNILLLSLLLGLSSTSVFSNTENQITKYENANLAVNYQGEIGVFLQLLSAKLGIGYYNENINSGFKISIKQDKDKNLSYLITQLNSQLKEQHILLNSFNDKVTLALVNKNREVLEYPKYISEINFNPSSQAPSMLIPEKSIEKEEHQESTPIIQEEPTSSEKDKLLKEQEEKMNHIVSLSQDEKLIEKYKRLPPQYSIENKEAIKLETIRSTKISTFLVFQEGINIDDYQIEGKFQDIAKLGNLVAILHRQKEPPKTITIKLGEQTAVIRKSN